MFGKASLEENCLNGKALMDRDWPGDRVIKRLHSEGKWIPELVLSKKDYSELILQLGSKFTGRVISKWGATMITEGKE